jgi:ribonuclease BN (tRNA processing enzyme)
MLSSGPDSLLIHAAAVSHPGGCLAYRIENPLKKCSFVFATDNEPPSAPPSPLHKLAQETDLLICDGQYTTAEHKKRIGWGHGTPELCLHEAVTAHARRLLITHFDPTHSDSTLAQMEKEFQNFAQKSGLPVAFARQGQTIAL